MAPPSRPARVADQIREELGRILARETRDPRIGFVTITRVQVTADLQLARVYFTVLGDATARRSTTEGLRRAMPFLRREVGQRLRLRRVPELRFIFDDAVERQERIEELLEQVRRERRPEEAGDADEDDPDGPEQS